MHRLRVDPSDSIPIWSQIEEGIRRLVACGALPAGESIPSVRDMARDLAVNPATVAKAYQKLTDGGVLSVRRGDGTYVADSPPVMTKGERIETVREGARRYASLAATSGSNLDEAGRELTAAWKEVAGRARGDKR